MSTFFKDYDWILPHLLNSKNKSTYIKIDGLILICAVVIFPRLLATVLNGKKKYPWQFSNYTKIKFKKERLIKKVIDRATSAMPCEKGGSTLWGHESYLLKGMALLLNIKGNFWYILDPLYIVLKLYK